MNPNAELSPQSIQERLTSVRRQLHDEAIRQGRDPNSVLLIAVSKGHPAAAIAAAAAVGQRDFGESYLQEALPKMESLKTEKLTWHYIGQIQSNKTRPIAEHFHWVHTVDRDRIATRLSEQRPYYAPALQICIQVKLAEEDGKGGVWPSEVAELAKHISTLPRLKLRGLMCIPPPQDGFDAQLVQFQQLQTLLAELNANVLLPPESQLDTLSMGMSDDHAAGIAAGATMVRIGTAIFGERPKT